jgi:hypothetical protein
MPWVDLDSTNTATVLRCVKLGVETAEEYEKQFGTSELAQKKTQGRLCKALTAAADGVRYVQIKYLDSYSGHTPGVDDVALFFQKMKWMSANSGLGNVWVLSVVFAQDGKVLPEPNPVTPDDDYKTFLNMLTAQAGPLHTFMGQADVKVTSLFTVGRIDSPPPNRKREISWLEYVARDNHIWTPQYGEWLFGDPILVDKNFDSGRIPGNVLEFWGFPDMPAFELTEMGFVI